MAHLVLGCSFLDYGHIIISPIQGLANRIYIGWAVPILRGIIVLSGLLLKTTSTFCDLLQSDIKTYP